MSRLIRRAFPTLGAAWLGVLLNGVWTGHWGVAGLAFGVVTVVWLMIVLMTHLIAE